MFKVGENNKEIQPEQLTAGGAHFAWPRAPWPPRPGGPQTAHCCAPLRPGDTALWDV